MSDIQFKRLERNGQYTVWVVSVHNERRNFSKEGKNHFVNDIVVKDDLGNYFKPEYVTLHKNQQEFIPGSQVNIKVVSNVGIADEIVPIVAGDPMADKQPTDNMSKPTPGPPAQLSSHVAGHSYSQAMTIAGQLMSAKITATGMDIDMDLLFKMATDIDHWLINKKAQHEF